MIRFSAFLVVAAVGTLIAGVVTSHLLLVYIAIGVSGVALLALGIGAAANWRELTGKPESAQAGTSAAPQPAAAPAAPAEAAPAEAAAAPAAAAPVVPPQVATPELATAPAAAAAEVTATRAAWSAAAPAGSSWPSYRPPEPARPVSPGPWAWRDEPAPREPVTPAASPADPRDGTSAVAEDQPSAPDDDLSAQDQTMIFRAQADTPATDSEPAAAVESADDSEPAEDSGPAAATAAPPADDAASPDDSPSSEALQALEVTVVPGVPRYHKASCILIRFMGDSDLDKMTMAAATAAGCTPCRACLPDSDPADPEPQA